MARKQGKYGKPYPVGRGVYDVRYTSPSGNVHSVRVRAPNMEKALAAARSEVYRRKKKGLPGYK